MDEDTLIAKWHETYELILEQALYDISDDVDLVMRETEMSVEELVYRLFYMGWTPANVLKFDNRRLWDE